MKKTPTDFSKFIRFYSTYISKTGFPRGCASEMQGSITIKFLRNQFYKNGTVKKESSNPSNLLFFDVGYR